MNRLIFGTSYLAMNFVALLLNLLVSYVILTTKDYISCSSYKILVQVNVTLLIQIVIHILTSTKTIFSLNFDLSTEKSIGAVLNFAWLSTMSLSLLLALDRFYVIVFSIKISRKKWIEITATVIAWLPGCCLLIFDLTPFTGYVFDAVVVDWIYQNGTLTDFAQRFEQVVTFSSLIGSFILYILIFAYIAKHSRSKAELRILIIAVLSFFYVCLQECVYQFGSFWLETSEAADMGVNTMFTAYPLFCQILHLMFSRKVRKTIVAKLLCRNSVEDGSTTAQVIHIRSIGWSQEASTGNSRSCCRF